MDGGLSVVGNMDENVYLRLQERKVGLENPPPLDERHMVAYARIMPTTHSPLVLAQTCSTCNDRPGYYRLTPGHGAGDAILCYGCSLNMDLRCVCGDKADMFSDAALCRRHSSVTA